MSLSGNINALTASVTTANSSLKLSIQKKTSAATAQGTDKSEEGNGVTLSMAEAIILDVESYREQLSESLDALAASLSDLDAGVASIQERTIKSKKENPELSSTVHEDDPFRKWYEEIFMRLNKYGTQTFLEAQANVSAERALPLLDD